VACDPIIGVVAVVVPTLSGVGAYAVGASGTSAVQRSLAQARKDLSAAAIRW
jgi:hypothetical protein